MSGKKNLTPEIIFEDAHLVVLSKPAGLLSQGERSGDANLVDWLRGHFGRHYVGLIHRLDRNTSGLMVVAKRSKAARRLTQALQEGEIKRWYQAWLCGKLPGPVRWKHWLHKDEEENQAKVYRAPHPGAKEAVLTAKPVRYAVSKKNVLTLAEICLETGRSHQIRAQAAFMGLPVLGDTKYGAAPSLAGPAARPALHSIRLEFPHPMSGERLCFEEPLPDEMRKVGGR